MTINNETKIFIDKIISSKEPVYFSCDSLSLTFETLINSQKEERFLLINSIPLDLISKVAKAKEFTLKIKNFSFFTNNISSEGEYITFPTDGPMSSIEGRKDDRFYFPHSKKINCHITNPYDLMTILSKPVIDLSLGGMSIRIDFKSHVFTSGTILPKIEVKVENDTYIYKNCEVVYSRNIINLNTKKSIQIGIKFSDID